MSDKDLKRLFFLTKRSLRGALTKEEAAEHESLKKDFERLLGLITDPIAEDLLRERYLKGRKWYVIALDTGANEDTPRKICSRAVAAVRRSLVSDAFAQPSSGASAQPSSAHPSPAYPSGGASAQTSHAQLSPTRPSSARPSSANLSPAWAAHEKSCPAPEKRAEDAGAEKAGEDGEQPRSGLEPSARPDGGGSRGSGAEEAHRKRVYERRMARGAHRHKRAHKSADSHARKRAYRRYPLVYSSEVNEYGEYQKEHRRYDTRKKRAFKQCFKTHGTPPRECYLVNYIHITGGYDTIIRVTAQKRVRVRKHGPLRADKAK